MKVQNQDVSQETLQKMENLIYSIELYIKQKQNEFQAEELEEKFNELDVEDYQQFIRKISEFKKQDQIIDKMIQENKYYKQRQKLLQQEIHDKRMLYIEKLNNIKNKINYVQKKEEFVSQQKQWLSYLEQDKFKKEIFICQNLGQKQLIYKNPGIIKIECNIKKMIFLNEQYYLNIIIKLQNISSQSIKTICKIVQKKNTEVLIKNHISEQINYSIDKNEYKKISLLIRPKKLDYKVPEFQIRVLGNSQQHLDQNTFLIPAMLNHFLQIQKYQNYNQFPQLENVVHKKIEVQIDKQKLDNFIKFSNQILPFNQVFRCKFKEECVFDLQGNLSKDQQTYCLKIILQYDYQFHWDSLKIHFNNYFKLISQLNFKNYFQILKIPSNQITIVYQIALTNQTLQQKMNKDNQSIFYSTVDSQQNVACLNKKLLDKEIQLNEQIFQENNKNLQHKIDIQERDQEIRHKEEKIKLLEQELQQKNQLSLSAESQIENTTDLSTKSGKHKARDFFHKSYFTQKTDTFKQEKQKIPMQILIENLEEKLQILAQQNQKLQIEERNLTRQLNYYEYQMDIIKNEKKIIELSMNELTTENDQLNFKIYQQDQQIINLQLDNEKLKNLQEKQKKVNEEKIQDLFKNTTSLIEICEDANRERVRSKIMYDKINQEDDLNREIIDNLTKTKNNLYKENQDLKQKLEHQKQTNKDLQQKQGHQIQKLFKFVKHFQIKIENFFEIYNMKHKKLNNKLQQICKNIRGFYQALLDPKKQSGKKNQTTYFNLAQSQRSFNSKRVLAYKKIHEYVDLKKHIKLIQKYQKFKQDISFEKKKLNMQIRHLKEDLEIKQKSFQEQKILLEEENKRLLNEVIDKNLRFSLLQEEQENSLMKFRKLVKKQNVRLKFYEEQIQNHNKQLSTQLYQNKYFTFQIYQLSYKLLQQILKNFYFFE